MRNIQYFCLLFIPPFIKTFSLLYHQNLMISIRLKLLWWGKLKLTLYMYINTLYLCFTRFINIAKFISLINVRLNSPLQIQHNIGVRGCSLDWNFCFTLPSNPMIPIRLQLLGRGKIKLTLYIYINTFIFFLPKVYKF